MIFAPVVSGYVFNHRYGRIYDRHSHTMNDGTTDCPDGIECYQDAYQFTVLASVVGIGLSMWCIKRERDKWRAEGTAGGGRQA